MSDLFIPGRAMPQKQPEIVQVPVLDHHDQTKIIGSIAIGTKFMPHTPNFHFEIAWRIDSKHPDGTPNAVSLVEVSLVIDHPQEYHPADQPIS